MRRPTYHRNGRQLEVKMTPMIDVIFLLLVFFVCTASFQPPERILATRMSLPGSGSTDLPPESELVDLEQVVVEIFLCEGRAGYRINQRDYRQLAEVRDVLEAVRQVKADIPVILDVAPGVPMEHVIAVYDVSRQAGLERVQFAVSE